MISMLEAIPLAMEYVQSPVYQAYGLTLSSRLPIRLPSGWRFPYDSFAGSFRVRQSMLILFVSDDGVISEEWNDFERGPHRDALQMLYEELAGKPPPNLPPLQTILPKVRGEHPDAIIESIETVWALNEEGKPDLYWRLGLIEGIYRFVIVVGQDQKATLDRSQRVPYLQKTLRSLSARPKWDLGRARFRRRSGNLTVKIGDLQHIARSKEHLRSQWTVWSCVSRVAEFVEGLGYGEFGLNNVRIEYLESDASVDGAAFDTVRGVPTISFLRGEGWAEALSIVLHELGHALWSLLYTRPPAILDTRAHKRELEGIQEGLSDYFAATILSDRHHRPIRIGGELAGAAASRYRLPRLVDGRPFTDLDLDDIENMDEHLIGQNWANFLFDLRQHIQAHSDVCTADDLILRAHTKPLLPDGGVDPTSPRHCYLASLRETAVALDLPFADDSFWEALATRHRILM